MLPRLEMSRDECRKCLRCLELDAYANMVSVLRAQGSFTTDKKKLLQELASVLHISNERHRAEIRRAVNDDKLSAIAEQLNGSNTGTDWAIEGRRIIPLLPRLKAHNSFTTLANSISLVTAIANEKQPPVIEKPFDVKVKAETDKNAEKQSIEKSQIVINSDVPKGRKRKRSAIEVFDQERNNHKNNMSQKMMTSNKSCSPSLPLTSSNKVLVVPSSSAAIEPGSRTSENVTCLPSTANILPIKKVTANPVNVNHTISNTTAVQNLIAQSLVCNNTKIQIHCNSSNSTVPINLPNSAKSESKLMTVRTKSTVKDAINTGPTNAIETVPNYNGIEETKDTNINAEKSTKLVSISNNGQKVSKSDLNSNTHSVKAINSLPTTIPLDKNVPPSNTLTTNLKSYKSSGPGPPSKEASKLTSSNLIHNKITSLKLNKIQAAKMAGTKLTSKGNIIVLQKSMLREITLSHAGKEVLGKVIVGGKNLRIANQQNVNKVTLMPHRTTQVSNCNGDQSTTIASTTNSITTIHPKTNNITIDTRREVPESHKTATPFDQGPTNFDVKFQAVLNQSEVFEAQDKSNDSTNSSIQEILDDTSIHENFHEKNENLYENSLDKNESCNETEMKFENNALDNEDNENDCNATVMEGFLDPQTGIYNIQSTDVNINDMEIEEFSNSNTNSTELNSDKVNEDDNCSLMETEETSTILDTTENTMLIIDEIDELQKS